jgi:glutathione S-transferase
MAGEYRIYGSEMSPYSVKVRSYFRFKQIPHRWIPRGADNEAEYRALSRLPIIPTVATPEGEGLQDSTPIIEAVEARHPEPSIHPADPALAFLSALIEEFGDEWGNKLMFHHRWFAPVDQMAAAQTLARLSLPRGDEAEIAARTAMIRERMTGRGHFVGSSPESAPLITDWWFELVDLLESHLRDRKYLFGARPAFGDFGLAGQMYEASVDPTCGAGLRARGPAVLDWCHRMMEPRDDGPFETFESLTPTLEPLLAYVGRYFLPWSDANARAIAEGAEVCTVELGGRAYSQGPQKYHARSLAALRARFAAAAEAPGLKDVLDRAGCTPYLAQ